MAAKGKARTIPHPQAELSGETDLLWSVDLAILAMDSTSEAKDVEKLFQKSLAEFCRLHALSIEPAILVPVGREFQWLRPSHGRGRRRTVRIPSTKTLEAFVDYSSENTTRLIESAQDSALLKAIGASHACLAAPVYTPNRHLLCVVTIGGASAEEDNRLRAPSVRRSLSGLISQLTIAYGQFERVHHHSEMQALWDQFLAHDLEPLQCLKTLADRIPRFLPDFGPLANLDRSPLAQIILLATSDKRSPDRLRLSDSAASSANHLIIRGTTGKEPSGTRVAFGRSISGLLLQSDDPYFCDDPTKKKYRGRYRNYFGGEGHRARTELVVRIFSDDYLVGVINLESARKNAFSMLDIEALRGLEMIFGFVAAVLDRRLIGQTETQAIITNTTRKWLDNLSQVYRHGMGSPSSAQKLDNENLRDWLGLAEAAAAAFGSEVDPASPLGGRVERLHQLVKRMRRTHARMGEAFLTLDRYAQDFIENVSAYADEGPTDLRAVVDSAIGLVNPILQDGRSGDIPIAVTEDRSTDTTRIYCSTLITQHFKSIFDNGLRAVSERMEKDNLPGEISITIDREDIPGRQEQSLNKAWVVRIRDNGGGVTEDELAALQRFERGTSFSRDGTGNGLAAAQKYIETIGGRVELDSKHGRFFEVALFLNEYNPSIHGSGRAPHGNQIDG